MLGDTSAKNSTTVLKSAAENDIIKTDTKAINEVESKSPTQTRGSPQTNAEGKASRETYSKHDKALYAAGVSFLHKNFPPENERLSEAHRLTTWWARRADAEAGDRTLISMNDVCYLVECFDDALNYYQVKTLFLKPNLIPFTRR